MISKELGEKLQELEEEYDVELMTVEDVQEFLKSDMEFMEKAFDEEIEYGKSSKDYVAGLNQGLFIAKQWYDIRLDEGF